MATPKKPAGTPAPLGKTAAAEPPSAPAPLTVRGARAARHARGASQPRQGEPPGDATEKPGVLGAVAQLAPIRSPCSRSRRPRAWDELIPIRHGRMLASPFAFFRGAAYIMASDLATTPRTGIKVQACGDAHLVNFGIFSAPDRSLVFDINDFDETLPGPWEWDVKRLAASFEVAMRDRGMEPAARRDVLLTVVRSYRESHGRVRGDEQPRRLVRAAWAETKLIELSKADDREERSQAYGEAVREGEVQGQPARARQAHGHGRRTTQDPEPAAAARAGGRASPGRANSITSTPPSTSSSATTR